MPAPCSADSLTIDADKFASPAHTYEIGSAQETFTWNDSHVTSEDALTDCGGFTWEIYKPGGSESEIDDSVYSIVGELTDATKTIQI